MSRAILAHKQTSSQDLLPHGQKPFRKIVLLLFSLQLTGFDIANNFHTRLSFFFSAWFCFIIYFPLYG